MEIQSKDNEKLKLVRKLADRKHREREGLFVTEGEDLLEAGREAGFEATILLTRAGAGLGGDEVEAGLLDAASQLGSGTRAIAVWPLPEPGKRPAHPGKRGDVGRFEAEVGGGRMRGPGVYLHGVGDPGNVGSIVRSAAALGASRVTLGPGCADAFGPKAIRGSMGAIFALEVSRGAFEETPAPRLGLVAHGGDPEPAAGIATLCLGAEREGLPGEIVAGCESTWTIRTRRGVESLGVAAAAAIALSRIGSNVGEESA